VTLLGLAGLLAVSLIGPALATPRRARVPVIVGELIAGVVLGTTGLRVIHPTDGVLSFLAQAGFGLVMLIAGSHVPIGNVELRKAAGRGLILAVAIGAVAVPVAAALSAIAHTHHTALYAVLLASSSAAIVMPIVHDDGLVGDRVLTLMAQVAIADTACIVALPLAADPSRAGRAAVGAVIVLAAAGLVFVILRELADRDLLTKLHEASVRRTFGIEMRISLAALFALAGLAVDVHVSVMLAGFAFGLVLAAIGTPRRLGSQLFAVTEGFLGPIFFIWLGASIDLRALVHHPRLIVLALGLAVATTVIHALGRLLGQPIPLAVLAGAQLGVPVAAVALGTRNALLVPGEGGAILAGAVITLGVAAVAGQLAKRANPRAAASPRPRAEHPAAVVPAPRRPSPRRQVATQAAHAEDGPDAEEAQPSQPSPPAAVTPSGTSRPESKRRVVPPGPPVRPPTPNPATKPIVQSNVRVRPSPRSPRSPRSDDSDGSDGSD
jgi:Kef-type K+ transport system membrane component KefB